jgi:hypothetical protein
MKIANSYENLPTKWQRRGGEAIENAIHCLKGCLISYKELFLDNELGGVDELYLVRI